MKQKDVLPDRKQTCKNLLGKLIEVCQYFNENIDVIIYSICV